MLVFQVFSTEKRIDFFTLTLTAFSRNTRCRNPISIGAWLFALSRSS
jgi:hypothetical protein